MSTARARIMFLTAVFIYGTIGPFVRFVDAPSEVVVLVRGLLGTLTIAIALLVRGRPLDAGAIRRNLPWMVGTGICLGLNWVFLFAAYQYTSIAVASVFNYTAPLIIVLLAPIVFSECVSVLKFACVAAAMVGVVLVSGVVGSGSDAFDPLGVGLGVLSALGFVGIVICNRMVDEVDSLERVLIQLGVAALVALVYVVLRHGGVPWPHDARSWAIMAMLGVIHTGLAYILWFGAQAHLPLQEIALLGYVEPVMNVLLSALVLGEPLTALGYVGASLVLGAAAASEVVE